MKTRAVLLGSGGWPFIIRYWLENFKQWEHKVDKVYLAIDRYQKPEFGLYLHSLIDGHPKIVLMENCHAWPNSYTDAFKKSKEDLFLIMHDDSYVIHPDILDSLFTLAEQNNVVTPLHEIYAPKEQTEHMLIGKYPGVFPLQVKENKGDIGARTGYSFLLYFLFVSREVMEKTTLDFNGFKLGDIGADTGFKFMLDVLDNKINILPIPRYCTSVIAYSDDPMKDLLALDLSSYPYLHLQNIGNTIPLIIDRLDVDDTWKHEGIIMRLGWLQEFMSVDSYTFLGSYMNQAKKKIHDIVEKHHIDEGRIQQYQTIFHKLMFGKE